MKTTRNRVLCVIFRSQADYEIVKRAAKIERLSFSAFTARVAIKAGQEIIALQKVSQSQRAAAD